MYRVELPDVLTIDVVQQVSQSSHILQAGDTVVLTVTGTFPEEPIAGEFLIGTGGVVELGYSYGAIEIRGLTVRDARTRLPTIYRSSCVILALRCRCGAWRIGSV